MTSQTSKPKNKLKLHFAALCRVSTNQQAEKGESLAVQKSKNQAAVKSLGGTIVEWYGGQEHGTEGHERKEINRLLSDAKKKKFNAFICCHGDRWSRDNAKSREGLEIFKQANIRFFILEQEYDLSNPENLLCLDMFAVIGAFFSRRLNASSIDSRIKKAKRGCPTSGTLPYGRTYDKEKEEWGIDEKKKADIEDIAERFLKGDRLLDLSAEYGLDKSGLNKILNQRCGDTWTQTFRKNGEVVIVKTKVPRLLPDKTIEAIQERFQANKTYTHGDIKNQYPLSRIIFCGHCGYAMFGQTVEDKYRYYRHTSTKHKRKCNRPPSSKMIKADDIEDIVFRHLFDMFGNPATVQKAIEAAIPDRLKRERDRKRYGDIDVELKLIVRGRDKIIRLVINNKLTESQAEKELDKLNSREKRLTDEQNRLRERRENSPDARQIKAMSKKVSTRFKEYTDVRLMLKKKYANRDYYGMSYEDKRELCRMIFSGKRPDGHRMGVFIKWNDEGYSFSIHGHFVDETGLLLMSDSRKEAWFGDFSDNYPHKQKELLTKSVSYLQNQSTLKFDFVLTGTNKVA